MKIRRMISHLFIIFLAAGIIVSLAGLIAIWAYRPEVISTTTDTLAFFDQTLNTTLDGLITANKLLQTPVENMGSLETATQALAQTLHDTGPMLDTLINLTGNDFPAVVDATQTSLASAQSSALLIDNTLATLASIPFLGLGSYAPSVPLHTSLAQVSTSLNSLKPSLATIHTSLLDGKTNLGVMELEITNISASIKEIRTSLDDAQIVIDQYSLVTRQLRERVQTMQRRAPAWITTIGLILSFGLVWLIVVQLELGMQGLEKLRGPGEAGKTVVVEAQTRSGA
jgi:hypothetical protein